MAAQEILLFVFIRSSMDVGVIITQAWPVVLLVAGLILTGQIFLLIWDSRRSKATDKAIRDVAAAFQYAGIPTYRQSLPDLKKEIDRLRRLIRRMVMDSMAQMGMEMETEMGTEMGMGMEMVMVMPMINRKICFI
jgi:hypothetical protein